MILVFFNIISGFNYQFLQKKITTKVKSTKILKIEENKNMCKKCLKKISQNDFLKKKKNSQIKNKSKEDVENQNYFRNFSLLKDINEKRIEKLSKLVSIDKIKSRSSFNLINNIEIDNFEEENKYGFVLDPEKELTNSKFQDLFVQKKNNAQILDIDSEKSFSLAKTKIRSK